MADNSTSQAVTRKEFYGALSLIWMYIAIIVGQFLNDNAKWPLFLLCFASLFMGLSFAVLTIREASRSKRPDQPN